MDLGHTIAEEGIKFLSFKKIDKYSLLCFYMLLSQKDLFPFIALAE